MNPKFFSIEEADRLIGFFERTLDRIKKNKQVVLWLREEIAILTLIVECGSSKNNPDAKALEEKKRRHDFLSEEIQKDKAAITEKGCFLRDEDRGVIDFYTIMDESVVFLCWQKGEDSVMYWHPIQTGFQGRQPLARTPSA
jgi:hypothetical protein